MYRFFVRNSQIKNKTIIIINNDVNHIKNVLRLKTDDKIEVVDIDFRNIYICDINKFLDNKIEVRILSNKSKSNESNVYIHVFQGIPKFEKMEWIIEKCIELGASEFTPVAMKRSVLKLDSKNEEKKIARWNKIAEVAAKQSKRDIIPTVNKCINLKDIYETVKNYDIVLVAYENEKKNMLKKELKRIKNKYKKNIRIAIIVGPEGGISEEEIKILLKFNFSIVSLGKRTLRTETAPISMVANINYELEGDQ